MGKLRSRFRDPLTVGEDHNLDPPEDSLRARAVLHFPCPLFQCSLFISRPKHLLGATSVVSRCKEDWGEKEASCVRTALSFSEYFPTLILLHNKVWNLKTHVLKAVFGPYMVLKHFKFTSNMDWKVSVIQKKISIECLQAEAIKEDKIDKNPGPHGAKVLVNGRGGTSHENLGSPLLSKKS